MPEPLIIKNKYRVLHEVGGGGMGRVFAVVHQTLGTTYALKQLNAELERKPDTARRFRHEAQMMARLQHPNIVRVFDIDSEPGFGTYLVMEFIQGMDLGKVLAQRHRLPYPEVIEIGLAIASALDFAHGAGLVHRDIKPGNILIEDTTGRAVVTDFGIAKQLEGTDEDNLTRTGSFVGTYRYCSPEQIHNDPRISIDGRADVYSLGIVLYEMSSGRRFLEGMSEMQIAHHVGFRSAWKPELEYQEAPPPEFERLIERCLARDRDARPTAAELAQDLKRCPRTTFDRPTSTASQHATEDPELATPTVVGAAPPEWIRTAARFTGGGWWAAAVTGSVTVLLAVFWALRVGPFGDSLKEGGTLPGDAPRIAGFAPATDTLRVREGTRQPFSVTLAGPAAASNTPIEWRLDDRVVATSIPTWDYEPDFTAASNNPHTVRVAIGTGSGESHDWQVQVEDVNRPPLLVRQPPPTIEVSKGSTANLQVAASDPDDDRLRYAWTIDGKPAGADAPELTVSATASHHVELTVSDGKDALTSHWEVVALAPKGLALDVAPRRLDTLRFNEPQQFALIVPSDLPGGDLEYAWTVDGTKVSSAPTFLFKNSEPGAVTGKPLSIVATATDGRGQRFAHEWTVRITPPLPSIASSSPRERTLEVMRGRTVTFDLQASPTVGAQTLTYVYEVDGRSVARGADGRFEFTPTDEGSHTVTGYLEDNYRQVSADKRSWTLRPSTVAGRVEQWLRTYEQAWNQKNAAKLAELRGMDAATQARLAEAFADKKDLRVTFSGIEVRPLGPDQATASYKRQDEWVGARDGKPVKLTRAVEQTFRLNGTRIEEVRLNEGDEP